MTFKNQGSRTVRSWTHQRQRGSQRPTRQSWAVTEPTDSRTAVSLDPRDNDQSPGQTGRTVVTQTAGANVTDVGGPSPRSDVTGRF